MPAVTPPPRSVQGFTLPLPALPEDATLVSVLRHRRSSRAFLAKRPPMATIAGLLWAAFGINRVEDGRRTAPSARNWQEVAIYVVTVLAIVGTNLLEGVLVGLGLSIAKLIYTFSHLEVTVKNDPDDMYSTMELKGAASFVRLPQLAQALEKVTPGAELHVRLDKLASIDHACFELLQNWEKQHAASGGKVLLEWRELEDLIRQNRPSVLHEPLVR